MCVNEMDAFNLCKCLVPLPYAVWECGTSSVIWGSAERTYGTSISTVCTVLECSALAWCATSKWFSTRHNIDLPRSRASLLFGWVYVSYLCVSSAMQECCIRKIGAENPKSDRFDKLPREKGGGFIYGELARWVIWDATRTTANIRNVHRWKYSNLP